MNTNPALKITAIPALQDNYIWLLRGSGNTCAVVDPGEAEPVLKVLHQQRLELSSILLTHHHYDHVDGVPELIDRYRARVFGPQDDRIPFVHQVCREGDEVHLPDLDTSFRVLEIPAHTRSHIAFFNDKVLFSGDTLFSLGCGRFFEGTAADMQQSLDKLAALGADTQVYCAHEYTQANCRFALAVEPHNTALKNRAEEIDRLRAVDQITLPTRLGDELATNPFLRTRVDAVVDMARNTNPDATPGIATMAVIRAWKDRF